MSSLNSFKLYAIRFSHRNSIIEARPYLRRQDRVLTILALGMMSVWVAGQAESDTFPASIQYTQWVRLSLSGDSDQTVTACLEEFSRHGRINS